MVRGPPLCPAGHLPLKGGDQMSRRVSPISNAASGAPTAKLPISPLEGEMPGRAERGAKDRRLLKPITPAWHPATP
ncbi:lytic murein transglycosylase [Mesorhizobium sp. M2E.F.Ca.ET.209.01.1.1]|nr:lytic murein transglycosylase [Mesorhizobium sp. M2E.F.Ca.ET.209.01.1.1]